MVLAQATVMLARRRTLACGSSPLLPPQCSRRLCNGQVLCSVAPSVRAPLSHRLTRRACFAGRLLRRRSEHGKLGWRPGCTAQSTTGHQVQGLITAHGVSARHRCLKSTASQWTWPRSRHKAALLLSPQRRVRRRWCLTAQLAWPQAATAAQTHHPWCQCRLAGARHARTVCAMQVHVSKSLRRTLGSMPLDCMQCQASVTCSTGRDGACDLDAQAHAACRSQRAGLHKCIVVSDETVDQARRGMGELAAALARVCPHVSDEQPKGWSALYNTIAQEVLAHRPSSMSSRVHFLQAAQALDIEHPDTTFPYQVMARPLLGA